MIPRVVEIGSAWSLNVPALKAGDFGGIAGAASRGVTSGLTILTRHHLWRQQFPRVQLYYALTLLNENGTVTRNPYDFTTSDSNATFFSGHEVPPVCRLAVTPRYILRLLRL